MKDRDEIDVIGCLALFVIILLLLLAATLISIKVFILSIAGAYLAIAIISTIKKNRHGKKS
jgi:hypothetical protein